MEIHKTIAQSRLLVKILLVLLIVAIGVSAILFPYLLSGGTSFSKKGGYDYVKGELASEDIFAPFSFDYWDESRTASLKNAAADAVLPYFSYSYAEFIDNIDSIDSFIAQKDFSSYFEDDGYSLNARLSELNATEMASLKRYVYDIGREMNEKGIYSRETVESVTDDRQCLAVSLDALERNEIQTVSEDNILYREDMKSYIEKRWNVGYFGSFQPFLLYDVLDTVLHENVLFDESLTMMNREKARASISDVVYHIQKNDMIAEKDSVINDLQVRLLDYIEGSSDGLSVLNIVGSVLYVMIVLACGVIALLDISQNNDRALQYVSVSLVMVFISLMLNFFISYSSLSNMLPFNGNHNYLILASMGPLLVALFTSDKRYAFICSCVLSSYYVLYPTANYMTFFSTVMRAIIVIYTVRYKQKRLESAMQWIYAILLCLFSTVVLDVFLVDQTFDTIFVAYILITVDIIVSFVVTFVVIPICERVFNLPTYYRLNELAYSSSPLLDRLEQVAGGTYNHCRSVADLAEVACRAIGANALLTRVAALYHDVGKMDHPEYFTENQQGENAHDDIKPSLSVAVIRSHVKLGVEKCKEAHLPPEVIKMVEEHHGNDVISYFYNEAKMEAMAGKSNSIVNEEDFCYNNSPPTTKESGILMLADCIEAASRSKRTQTIGYHKLINDIIMGKMERGQLDLCGMTITELGTIALAFEKALVAKNHKRIDYPKENTEK